MDTSNRFADEIMQSIKSFLVDQGVSKVHIEKYDTVIYTILIFLIAFVLARLVRIIVLFLLRKYLKYSKRRGVRIFLEMNVFERLSHLVPPIILLSLLPFAFEYTPKTLNIIERFCWIYLIVAFIASVNLLLTAMYRIFSHHNSIKNKPVKGLVQIVQAILMLIALIVIVAILVNKSPLTLITGLGAFAAILLLVFKDSILGFVAGVQLSQNDMLRTGDWISMPGNIVNGTVLDVTLNTVKVQNFDNTIVTIPPYSLVSGAFQNWRGMSESGGRRIVRSVLIDMNSVCFLREEDSAEISQIQYMGEYIEKKKAQLAANKVQNTNNSDGLVDGTIETNLGLFRAYLEMYLSHHPFINTSLTLLVRTLPPNENGIPLEIYCFSHNKEWVAYESIQAEITEHFISMIPKFKLSAFQNASGRDYVYQSLISSGVSMQSLIGIPRDIDAAAGETTPKKD